MIHRDGPRRLQAWGLLDRLVRAGTPPVRTVLTDFGDGPVVAADLEVDGVAWGYGPRRRVVDQILLDAAIDAGAEFREGVAVDALTFERQRVVGIRGRSGNGVFNARGRVTIGADGRHSRVAQLAGAPEYEAVPPLLCYYFSYWSGVASDRQEIYNARRRLAFAFPTNDSLFAVFAAWPVAMFPEVRSDIERHFMALADGFADLGDRLRAGRREERFYGTADLPNFYRKPYGDGWALVGDASHHKDPYLALGMSDALRGAELLASAMIETFAGKRPMDEALTEYERRRNEASMADYRENLSLARMEPMPSNVSILRRRS